MSVRDELRSAFLTASLAEEQRVELAAAGREVAFAVGDEIWHEGRPADHLWILLDGRIELTRRVANQSIVLTTMTTPGQWAGGLLAWGGDDTAPYRATGRALTSGRCLAVPSDELARLVGAWSPFATHMIRGVYQTVRGIDATARERDSLVALGTLAARLAHEINNPASASMRAVESLQSTEEYMLSSLVALAEHGIRAQQFLALDRMRVELAQRPEPTGGALAVADLEEELGSWMDERGVDLAWRIAPVLAACGADRAWLDEVEALVGWAAIEPSLRWISSTIGSTFLLAELAEATGRIAHLVEDVKTYSQMDRAALRRVDLRAGLESTLAMLGPALHDIEVEWAFGADVPAIDAYGAELNQVWTNLIENSVDAMDGRGTLRLATRLDDDHVVVEITDSGPGIDPDALAHVFEPFFTTKDVGQGTGLGLDISRRIVVDRHGGQIDFDTSPNGTTARVRLPIRT